MILNSESLLGKMPIINLITSYVDPDYWSEIR